MVGEPCPVRFQSTLPGWGATRVGVTADAIQVEFQSTLPGWGATASVEISDGGVVISIHAPRMGSDYPITITPLGISALQSTLPGWGATRRHNHGGQTRGDFNPRSPDGERHGAGRTARDTGIISIHAPRMGSDTATPYVLPAAAEFQSTLPGWGATVEDFWEPWLSAFQSTLPGWGATSGVLVGHATLRHFNPRSPDGERPMVAMVCLSTSEFQSTLPGWGATTLRCPSRCPAGHFNPRSPDGERPSRMIFPRLKRISIHAPRMGSDGHQHVLRNHHHHISIHAPRMGSDPRKPASHRKSRHFNPRSPDGERLGGFVHALDGTGISIHAPRMGSDKLESVCRRLIPFQSTLPGWGATIACCGRRSTRPYFNPRSPDGERRHETAERRIDGLISIHAPRMGSDCEWDGDDDYAA